MNLSEISIEKLNVSLSNVRKSFSKSGIEEMKASILAHGLLSNRGLLYCYFENLRVQNQDQVRSSFVRAREPLLAHLWQRSSA
jgi:hypothetical protein